MPIFQATAQSVILISLDGDLDVTPRCLRANDKEAAAALIAFDREGDAGVVVIHVVATHGPREILTKTLYRITFGLFW